MEGTKNIWIRRGIASFSASVQCVMGVRVEAPVAPSVGETMKKLNVEEFLFDSRF